MSGNLVQVRNLTKRFEPTSGGVLGRKRAAVTAVDDVSFDVPRGSTVAIVGESGSGKTTTGRCVLRLVEPTSGSIEFDGTDITHLDARAMRKLRSRMQIIFQDTYASLDPRWTVGRLLREPLALHTGFNRKQQDARVAEVLETVGLQPDHARRFPHEFSGGQRQRIGIARALLLRPELIVCDEPVSALDVSVQAQVLNLMRDLQQEFGLTYLFISHDLSVVRFMADQVLTMCNGQIVERGDTEQVFSRPEHPYTKALLAAVPEPDPHGGADRAQRRKILREGLAAV